ncbi:MAG TPA: nitroreductase family protein [Saprospiraceae bacterium]|nr:nitroreductase family protein [Saprospiraceae bacterium]
MSSIDIFNDVLPESGNKEILPEINAEEFCKVVETRRSVRVYTEESIPEEIVHKCLKLALLAPNSSNLQPWQFYWVRDPEKKARLIKYCLSQPSARTAAEIIVAVARIDTWEPVRKQMMEVISKKDPAKVKAVRQYYERIVPLAYNQGPWGVYGPVKKLVLYFRGLKTPTPRGPSSLSDMWIWAHKNTALACENLMLAFRAYGFDSCPMEGNDPIRIKKLLGLPNTAQICMVITAGKRAHNGVYGNRIRFDENQFIKII